MSNTANWEQRRYEIAKEAMIKLMEYDYYRDDATMPNQRNSGLLTNRKPICSCAVSYADELIEQLKNR